LNHPLTRLASRRRYGQPLEGGVAIHEYQPAMMHAKILIVDRLSQPARPTSTISCWLERRGQRRSCKRRCRKAGSRFRSRSPSAPGHAEEWRRRALAERAPASFARLLERQA
jgi:cardiolipin synthase